MNAREFKELHLGCFKPDDSYESILKRVKQGRCSKTADELYAAHMNNGIKDKRIAELEALCKECADYLDTNKFTNIQSNSLLHHDLRSKALRESKR